MLPPGGLDHLRALARESAPDECCGVLLGDGGTVLEIRQVRNVAPEGRFEMDPDELIGILTGADDAGLAVVGSFHSHPRGRARPSVVDVGAAVGGWVMVIVGRRHVRAWSLADGPAREVPLVEGAP